MIFSVTTRDKGTRARTGLLRTAHGEVETPVFMPVATQGSVKALDQGDLAALGAQIILANSYHLYLRPGAELLEAAGGLHRFMDYPGSILTDSGGFQIFSLEQLRKVNDEGATFQSHHDGSLHTLTPESVVRLQARIGSDIWTVLDECVAYPCPEDVVRAALERTRQWGLRSRAAFLKEKERGAKSLFFPILQGGLHPALRRQAAQSVLELEPDGVCLGGFSVGEPKELTWSVLESAVEQLPEDKPRYLMGMGAAADLWDAVARGVDMMDCVWPTRNARNGQAFVHGGVLNVKNAEFRNDLRPIEEGCPCPACRRYSRAYLCHLYRCRELSVYRLLTLHNLHFTMGLMREIRAAIKEGRFEAAWKEFRSRQAEVPIRN